MAVKVKPEPKPSNQSQKEKLQNGKSETNLNSVEKPKVVEGKKGKPSSVSRRTKSLRVIESSQSSASNATTFIDEKRSKDYFRVGVDERYHLFGMYRTLQKESDKGIRYRLILNRLIDTFPYPPKRKCYVTSGYYKEFNILSEANTLKDELRIEHVPKTVSNEDFLKLFPRAMEVRRLEDRPEVFRILFESKQDAETAYDKAKKQPNMMGLADQKVLYLQENELAVTHVPEDLPNANILAEFPSATSVTMYIDEKGKQVANVAFDNRLEAQAACDKCRYEKQTNPFLKYTPDKKGFALLNLKPSNGYPPVTEADIKNKFPTSTAVHAQGITKNGTAKIRFTTDAEQKQAFITTDLFNIGKQTLAWKYENQVFITDLPDNTTVDDVKIWFSDATDVQLVPAGRGKLIALVMLPSPDEADLAYGTSFFEKTGPKNELQWVKGLDQGSPASQDPDKQIRIHGLTGTGTAEDIQKQFPNAAFVKINRDDETAIVYFSAQNEAQKALENCSLPKLGGNNVLWKCPNSIYIKGVASKQPLDAIKKATGTENIKGFKGVDSWYVMASYPSAEDRQKAEKNITYPKRGPQLYTFMAPRRDKTPNLIKQWNVGPTGFSNISNLFTAALELHNVPLTENRANIMKLFKEANVNVKKVDLKRKGRNTQVATVEFATPQDAAFAYGTMNRTPLVLKGNTIKLRPKQIGGSAKK